MKNQIPNTAHLMIIGAMKSGTTSLFDMLKSHPEICPSKPKEPEFFSRQGHRVQANTYSELFDFDPAIHVYAMDGSTGYTKYPREADVPKRIKQAGLEPKFIYVVRHPIERIVSNLNYWNNFPQWSAPMDNLEHMVDISKYHMQLSQYTQHFSKDSILIIDFEDLIGQRENVLRSICSFLGISTDYKKSMRGKSNVTVPKGKLELFIIKHFSKWFKYLPKGLKARTKASITKYSKTEPIKLTELQETQIRQALQDDMSAFQRDYGFDVSKWGF
ncbi:sulfotransferase [Subsaxibacter sp. CAU 1640]|uniref:sulfotransferase family protein n=1 Tax=Subsaxibacter sp. CAU 1640 TaxID=2933271 RepID=UPI0020060E39|nr:sulfotransferase [Subsaxibacter sp. CAU 1640]MCK7590233.1 sulfotransferase [Subsaxibacter sp. CAU 1640]